MNRHNHDTVVRTKAPESLDFLRNPSLTGQERHRLFADGRDAGRTSHLPKQTGGFAQFPRLVRALLLLTGAVFATKAMADPAATSSMLKQLSMEELMDIEVTSVSKRSEKLWEAASAIQVITGEDVRRSGAATIPQALRLANNLQVAQKNPHDWAISARGFNTALSNKLLVLMDGRSVYTPLFSGVFWDTQDYLLEDIDRIEVISGPGGSLWGANAMNGVINITTKSAKDTQGLYLEGGAGEQLQDFASVRYGGTLDAKTHFRIYAKHLEYENGALPDGTDAFNAWSMDRGGFRIDSSVSPENTLTVQGDYYEGKEDLNIGKTAKVSGGNILGRWTRTFSDESDMSLQVYYDRTHLLDPIPPVVLAPAGFLTDNLDTCDVDFQHRFRRGEHHHFVWGLGYRFTHDEVTNAPGLAFFPATLDHHLFSGFVQDEISLREDVALSLGTKVEHNDYTGFEAEPSGRLQWNVTPNHTLWAAVSHAVRTPSRVDRDMSQPDPAYLPVILRGNPDFISEKLNAYELGYRGRLGSKTTASISAFYNDYSDIRSTSLGPLHDIFGVLLPFPFFFENNLEAETYGIEMAVNCQALEWWRLRGGYNLLREDVRVKAGQADFNEARNETADPEHQFLLGSSMDLPGRLELDSTLRWVDTLHLNDGPAVGIVPSYFELDVRLSWHPTPHLEASVVGQNLLHAHHPEYGFPSPTREEIRRSIYGRISWRY